MRLFRLSQLFHSRAQSVMHTVRYFHRKDEQIIHHLRNSFMCNLEAEFDDIPSIERRFSERGCEPSIDLRDLKELYALLRRQTIYNLKLQANVTQFESDDTPLGEKKKKPAGLKSVDLIEETDQKKYYLLYQIETFERCFLRLRNFVLYHCFLLPNELHVDTPRADVDRIIWSNIPDGTVGRDHIEVGHRLGVLEYSSSARYYLLNEAANIEIALQRYVSHVLTQELNFKSFRNPDTCHEFVMNGIYLDDSKKEGLFLENCFHRLVGGASFPSFCAYKVGTSTHAKFLPERFFTCGRRYLPPTNDIDKGLYSVRQRSNIQAFITTSSEEEIRTEYERTLEWLISLYERLGLHFRICNMRASALHGGESLCTRLQLYSAHRHEFIDAAHISFSGDYISQRLHIINHDKDTNHFTTWLLDIAVLSVPIIVANLLEKTEDEILIPDCLVPYMYKTSPITSIAYK